MTIKRSTGFINAVIGECSGRNAIAGGKIILLSSTAPTTADDAVIGQTLATLTDGGGAWTAETRAQWQITFSGTVGGSVSSVKVSAGPLAASGVELLAAAVTPVTDLTTTAALVAAAINNNIQFPKFSATASGAVVTISAPIGSGIKFNSTTCACTATTITATVANSGAASTAGVASANGIDFGSAPVSGIATTSETWSGSAVLAGTPTHFRIVTDGNDTGALSTVYRRMQGTVGLTGSGADLELSTTTFVTSPSATPISVTGGTLFASA